MVGPVEKTRIDAAVQRISRVSLAVIESLWIGRAAIATKTSGKIPEHLARIWAGRLDPRAWL